MTIAQKVQRDLVEELIRESNLTVKDIEITTVDKIYENLAYLGFKSSKDVIAARNNVETINTVKSLNSVNSSIKAMISNSQYKVISFTKLCKVLEKYNLYIGKSENYTKEIPLKNAKEIIEYSNLNLSNYHLKNAGIIPISTQLTDYYMDSYSRGLNLFICGSLDNFKEDRHKHTIGREVVYNSLLTTPGFKLQMGEPNPDPIVLNLILTGNKNIDRVGLFHIVTAWDREALDIDIINEKQN